MKGRSLLRLAQAGIAVALTVLVLAALWTNQSAELLAGTAMGLVVVYGGLGMWHEQRTRRQETAARVQLSILQHAYDLAPVGVAVVDASGKVRAANRAFQEMTARGADLTSITAGNSRTSSETARDELSFLGPDGQRWLGRMTLRPLPSAGQSVYFLEDVTGLAHAEQTRRAHEMQLNVQRAVMAALAGATSSSEAVPPILRAIADHAHWDVAIFWLVDRGENVLRCRHTWRNPAAVGTAFTSLCEQITLPPGAGLPARTWQGREARWLDDPSADGNVGRALKAEREGLSSAFSFPIVLADGMHGVVELWSQRHQIAQPEYLQAMIALGEYVAAQLSRFLQYEKTEESLRDSEERYRAITEMAQDAIITIDEESRIQSVNEATERLFGYTRSELVGGSATVLMPEAVRAAHLAAVKRYCVTGAKQMRWDSVEVTGLHKNGTTILLEVSLAESTQGARRAFTAYMRDITQRRQEESALVYQALHDTLTDLPNRRLLQERLGRAITTAQRHRSPVALLFMDLDRFKEVNDSFGHHVGDLLLQQIAGRLAHTLRDSDTVARLGGDEFALLLPLTDENGATQAAWRIADALHLPFGIEGQEFEIGASIGIALYPEHGTDAATLMRRADVAMYAAKRNGGGNTVYSPARDEANALRLVLTGELRQAIDRGQLLLHYQPKVSLKDGRTEQVEALVRWIHPERGFTPPDAFIPLAEETGLVKPLTMWVLEEALRQHCVWREEGFNIRVSVNFSARTLHDPELVDTVTELLESHHVEPSRLQLEITESALMLDPDRALETLTRLREAGVWTSIDDFGTGYSSLGYLKRLPVDEIKIDKSFVLDMAANRDDVKIVRSIVALGHNLGLDVVAEGVDNKRTLDMLADMGCDVAQGYYLSRPVAGRDMSQWLREQGAATRSIIRFPELRQDAEPPPSPARQVPLP